MGDRIRPNDIVLHKPSGERWVVAGVHFDGCTLIPKGYPFPSVAKTEDCELLESHYVSSPQEEGVIRTLMEHGLNAYIDVRSALLYGII